MGIEFATSCALDNHTRILWFKFTEEYGYCTVSSNYGCKREGRYGMLPPIMSGRLRSKGTIRYGKVEIIAKLPRGDWIWPGKCGALLDK